MKLPCESAKQNHRPQGGLVQQNLNVVPFGTLRIAARCAQVENL
jgi:hypothetical protein